MKKPLLAAVLAAFSATFSTELLRAQTSSEQLTKADVEQIIAQAATQAMWSDPGAIIAVTDREGFVVGVWDLQGRIPSPLPALDLGSPSTVRSYGLLGGAITRAGTAAFLSSDQEALTTRSAGYIIQQHFPPGVSNTPPGPLVGVGFSSLFFSDINRLKQIANPLAPAMPFDSADLRASLTPGDTKRISPGVRGVAAPLGSLNDSPGGVPLYKNGHLVGAIGVTGDGTPTDLAPAAAIFLSEVQLFATAGYVPITQADADEFVALAGQTGFRPSPSIVATNVFINGIRIPYVYQPVENIADVANVLPLGSLAGHIVDGFPTQAPPPPYPYPVVNLGGVVGEMRGPVVSDSTANPGGVIRFIDDPLSSVPGRNFIGGASRLTAAEVQSIITKAAYRASITRAGIRLPLGSAAQMFITVVNNPAKALEEPTVLGTFRTGDATIFSWDVAIQKARTAVFFSNRQLAMSTRAVGFLAERYYPPGIDGTPFGPFFGFQEAVSLKREAGTGKFPGNPNLPNGITIFPGGFPLYRNGELIGAIG
ncbi:MAG: heme-binding protein, partial [Chthoniobacteraceae bacterium]